MGIIARKADALPYIWHSLDKDTVTKRFSHVLQGDLTRYLLPGCHGMNLVLTRALGGGGVASLCNDALGKGFAQILLQAPVTVPRSRVEDLT